MIRGHPLRKTGSAASHGGLSTELFYYKSGRLATGKKQMWRVSQKIHRGSLAFFGKWDKINRIRGDATAPEVRRPAESPGRLPPLGKGAEGTGVRIATTSLRTGLAMTHYKKCMGRRDTWVPPYNHIFCRAGPACPAAGAGKTRAGRCRHRPLRNPFTHYIFTYKSQKGSTNYD